MSTFSKGKKNKKKNTKSDLKFFLPKDQITLQIILWFRDIYVCGEARVNLRIALFLSRLSNCREIRVVQEMRSLTSLSCKENICYEDYMVANVKHTGCVYVTETKIKKTL